jgi:hypothetical protein
VLSIAAVTTGDQNPVLPQGVLPGQLGVILLGRVIMGDIAATLADLAAREAILVEETPAGGWLVSVDHGFDDHGLADFEKVLLHELPRSPEPIGEIADSVPERVRSALIHDGVARGWLRHLHHAQRTPSAEGLARQLRAFHRELRQRQQSGQDLVPGWRPDAPARSHDDEAISISSDHDLSNAANLAWAAGLI